MLVIEIGQLITRAVTPAPQVTEVPMDPVLVILGLIAIFIILGFLRGLVRELILTVFILSAIAIMTNQFDSLVAWINRLYRMAMFVLKGGIAADNPVAVWENVKKLSPLVETPQERLTFQIAMMGAALILGYIVGNLTSRQRLSPVSISLLWRPGELIPRLLGAIGGAVNGYLVGELTAQEALDQAQAQVEAAMQ
jgi:ABC-type cobalt transport system substrate-binding protein